MIEIKHPKISCCVEKIKIYTKNFFDNLISDLANDISIKNKKFNACTDILNFAKKLYKKYKLPLTIKLINLVDEDESKEILNISIQLKLILNIEINDINELNVENQNDEDIIDHKTDSDYDLEKSHIESNESDEGNYEDNLFDNKPKPFRPKANKRKRIINDLDDIYDS